MKNLIVRSLAAAAGRKATPADLAGYPWVVAAPGAPMRTIWEKMFHGSVLPERTVQCGSILATRGLLLAGDWMALMSYDQFRIERQAGLIDTIGPAVAGSARRIGIVVRRDWRPTAAQAAFLAALRIAARGSP